MQTLHTRFIKINKMSLRPAFTNKNGNEKIIDDPFKEPYKKEI